MLIHEAGERKLIVENFGRVGVRHIEVTITKRRP